MARQQMFEGFAASKEARRLERHKKLWNQRAKLSARAITIGNKIRNIDFILERDFGGKDEPPAIAKE